MIIGAPSPRVNMHSNVWLSKKTLSSGTTKPITFFYISMHNSSVFVFTTLQELTCHRSLGNNADISLSVKCLTSYGASNLHMFKHGMDIMHHQLTQNKGRGN